MSSRGALGPRGLGRSLRIWAPCVRSLLPREIFHAEDDVEGLMGLTQENIIAKGMWMCTATGGGEGQLSDSAGKIFAASTLQSKVDQDN